VSGAPECSRRKRARVRERVHRPASEHLVCLDVGEVLARDIHDHKWIEVDVCLLGDGPGLGGTYILSLGAGCRERHRTSECGGEGVLSAYDFHCRVLLVFEDQSADDDTRYMDAVYPINVIQGFEMDKCARGL